MAFLYSMGVTSHYYSVEVFVFAVDFLAGHQYIQEKKQVIFWEGIYDIIFEMVPVLLFFWMVLHIIKQIQQTS